MTAQHHILKECSDTLQQLLTNVFKDAGYKRVHIINKAPKPDEIEGKLPAVSMYLYSVSPDAENMGMYTRTEMAQVVGGDGNVIEVERPARMWVKLEYLVATWAQTPEDEQLLMGLVIRSLVDNHWIPRDRLKGESFQFLEDDFGISLQIAGRLDDGSLSRFWGSLNQPIRPALQAWMTVPVLSSLYQPFRRVEERVINYERVGLAAGGSRERGPDGRLDMPPEGEFRKRTE
jgi:Pvc16 N-terminal domain